MTINNLSKTFKLNLKELETISYLISEIENIVTDINGKEFYCKIDKACDHNFGSYASGYRVFLNDLENTYSLYAYIGLIYSYKKNPAGLFAEIDKFSNESIYEKVNNNIKDSKYYSISKKEEGFLKIFYPDYLEFIKLDKNEQNKSLNIFIKECFKAFLKPLTS